MKVAGHYALNGPRQAASEDELDDAAPLRLGRDLDSGRAVLIRVGGEEERERLKQTLVLMLLLFVAGVCIVFQPMQMRGMLLP